MKQLIIFSFIIFIGFSSCKTLQKSKANPQKELKTAINYAIKLLETDKHEIMLKNFIEPDKAEKIIEEEGGFKELAENFKKKKAGELLIVLKHIKDKTPAYNTDKTEASFKLDEGISHKGVIEFKKHEDLWYIGN